MLDGNDNDNAIHEFGDQDVDDESNTDTSYQMGTNAFRTETKALLALLDLQEAELNLPLTDNSQPAHKKAKNKKASKSKAAKAKAKS